MNESQVGVGVKKRLCQLGVVLLALTSIACGGGSSNDVDTDCSEPCVSTSSSSSASSSSSSSSSSTSSSSSSSSSSTNSSSNSSSSSSSSGGELAADWTDLSQFLVTSDGSHSLGDPNAVFNDTRDEGSKIVYFNAQSGDNEIAEVYWWDGTRLVDSTGSAVDTDGNEYGTDPLQPNELAIKPFKDFLVENDDRLCTQQNRDWNFDATAGGYPDWFLFRRGQTFTKFDLELSGGRSREEPMVVTAYGPLSDTRPIFAPEASSPFGGLLGGNSSVDTYYFHQVVTSLEIGHYGWIGGYVAKSSADGEPITAYLEDMHIRGGEDGLTYLPTETTVKKSVVANASDLGYWTYEFEAKVTFDEVIFFRNGFATSPLTDPDPVHDKFTRNIYQGGGAKMGHTYRNIISAFGGSGGPQMRLGGLLENSLIIEGYFYCSTNSNNLHNAWLEADNQTGQSCIVRDNVQLVYRYPNIADPDTYSTSDTSAQPGHGFTVQGATFGAEIEGNIISGAMIRDELGGQIFKGLGLEFSNALYDNGSSYNLANNSVTNNIVYAMRTGLEANGSIENALGNRVENNIFVSETPVGGNLGTVTDAQLDVVNNLFYTSGESTKSWYSGNTKVTNEAYPASWSDPDRTIKRYVTEELGLTLLEWSDDPFLDSEKVQLRIDAGEAYDPSGVKTFMAVAEHMRYGGTVTPPVSGKPSLTSDYAWDERFTGKAVVNWIRAGFNMPAVD